MHCNNESIHTLILLLFEGLKSSSCSGLPYGDMDQTLLIDDEFSKALRNPKWSGLFLEPFRDMNYPKTMCNG
jgi:hypothetical protein